MRIKRLGGVVAVAVVALGALAIAGCGGQQASASSNAAASVAASPAGGPVLPVPSDPIVNTSTKPGLEITGIMVENNVDPVTKQDLSDRLQMTLVNTSSSTLSDLEVYYNMTDSKTNKSEGYYQKLTGLTIAPGASQTIYFDTESGPGHYPENIYSLYRTSPNEVVIDVKVSAPGYAPATAQVKKAVGTGEKAGE
jgi:hypothetical protein